MRIKIAVCDSDREAGAYLGGLIAGQEPGAMVEVFASAEELLACDRKFHIHFLDIKGVDGMEIARCLREREQGERSIIIFVTGYREYMEEAFDVQAFHYLLKPIDREKFAQVLERACREAAFSQGQKANHVLLKVMGREDEGGGRRKVLLQDIYYYEEGGGSFGDIGEERSQGVVGQKLGEIYGKMFGKFFGMGNLFSRVCVLDIAYQPHYLKGIVFLLLPLAEYFQQM